MGRKYSLEVVRAEKHILGAKITVEATAKSTAVYDSFLGERKFYLKEGRTLRLLVKGRDWQRGDTLPMSTLVDSAWHWSDIPWKWN